jgi:hypothetical protein
MRIRTIVICAMTALGVAACGSSGSRSASLPTPPGPVVLSALVSGTHVSVSPVRVGAGPVLLTVTNQGRHSAAVTLSRAGRSLARTAPINPQGATQIKVDLSRGVYRVALASAGSRRTDAQKSRGAQPAATGVLVRVGRRRDGGADQLLSP